MTMPRATNDDILTALRDAGGWQRSDQTRDRLAERGLYTTTQLIGAATPHRCGSRAALDGCVEYEDRLFEGVLWQYMRITPKGLARVEGKPSRCTNWRRWLPEGARFLHLWARHRAPSLAP